MPLRMTSSISKSERAVRRSFSRITGSEHTTVFRDLSLPIAMASPVLCSVCPRSWAAPVRTLRLGLSAIRDRSCLWGVATGTVDSGQ